MLFDVLKLEVGMGIAAVSILLSLIISIAFYVFQSAAHMKALQRLGYHSAWLAWIPYVQYYACADAVCDKQEQVFLFNKLSAPAWLLKFWWVLTFAVNWLSVNAFIVTVLKLALQVFFLGAVYTKMYARLEYKAEEDTQVIGCISGLLPIIASIKFIMLR